MLAQRTPAMRKNPTPTPAITKVRQRKNAMATTSSVSAPKNKAAGEITQITAPRILQVT